MSWDELDVEFQILSSEDQSEWMLSMKAEHKVFVDEFLQILGQFIYQIEKGEIDPATDIAKLN